MTDRPLAASAVNYHAHEIGNAAIALLWADNEHVRELLAGKVRDNFAKLRDAVDELEAALAPVMSDEDFEPDEPNEAEPLGAYRPAINRADLIAAGRGHLLGE